MKNIDKGIELTGKTAEYLINNECVFSIGILPSGGCTEECDECWHSEFIHMVPDCYKQCDCEVCEMYEVVCCINKKEECKGNCVMKLA